jgi:hypothetical protein
MNAGRRKKESQPEPLRDVAPNLSPEEEKKLLSWLSEGLDIEAAAALFKKEFNREADKNEIVKLWAANCKQLHLERRNYFAQIASAIVDNRCEGESALEAASAYLLKQTLFEALISPEKDVKAIETLIKAMKVMFNGRYAQGTRLEGEGEKSPSGGISEDKLNEIEEIIRIL